MQGNAACVESFRPRSWPSSPLLRHRPLAAPRTDCQPQAIRDLQRLSPQGHASLCRHDRQEAVLVLSDLRQRPTRTCDRRPRVRSHADGAEGRLSAHRGRFPQAGAPRCRASTAPREIAKKFDQGDIYVQTYLRRGSASSADDFAYLLDELNAYSHDLNSAIKLVALHKGRRQVDHRAGLAALMSFTMGYVDAAQRQKSPTWQGLQRPEVKQLIQTLWSQAETVLDRLTGRPGDRRREIPPIPVQPERTAEDLANFWVAHRWVLARADWQERPRHKGSASATSARFSAGQGCFSMRSAWLALLQS